MAAVFTEKDGSLQSNNESSSTEHKKGAVQVVSIDPVGNSKAFNAKNRSGEMESSPSGPIMKTQDHAEVVVTNAAVTPIKIKVEQVDEDECVAVHLVEVGEGDLDGRATRKGDSPERNETADVNICSMRCQDLGQQFNHWKAFKIHHHKHVEEKVDLEKQNKRKHVESAINKTENGLGCCKKNKVIEKKVQNNIKSFDRSWQTKPSGTFNVQPCVEENPVYNKTKRVYACSVCGKVYSYLESFRNHQKMHVNSKSQQSTEISCQKCKKTFACLRSLTLHMKCHKECVPEEPSNLHCAQCNKSFSRAVEFVTHQEMHKQRPHWCILCTKGFKSSEGLKRHLLGHDNKKHTCDICHKSFRVPAELRYHYNIHTGAKPYTCNLCHKNFSQLGNLITHQKKHLGVFKEGEDVALGRKYPHFRGRKRVLVMKKVIVGTKNVFCQEEGIDEEPKDNSDKKDDDISSLSNTRDSSNSSSELLHEEAEPVNEEWECFECGAHFLKESELHTHYIKHARGEI